MKFFPFAAIVGQEKAKLALICSAIDPTIGGVLLSGDKGTGKSTMVRAFSQVLPEIEVFDGCPFNCNPYNVAVMCELCKERAEKGDLRVAKRPMRVIDLPLSVSIDRLVGTIDLGRALKEGIRAIQPGILAEANRNILYIDEVNLLEDYLADVLLDSAALGWNVVEREGISLKHPAKFILIGSMNPEEGELRPQLLDRFGMFVPIEASTDVEERVEIVRRVTEFQKDPLSFYEKYKSQDEKLRDSIINGRKILQEVEVQEELMKLLAETIIQMGIKTHRAEITTVKAAKAIAAFEGRKSVSIEDLKRAMELTLPHRIKSKPFEKPHLPELKLPKGGETKEKKEPKESLEMMEKENYPGDSEKLFNSSQVEMKLGNSRDHSENYGNRTSRDCKITLIGEKQGVPISFVPSTNGFHDVNILATLNSAALRGFPFKIEDEDIKINVRKARAPRLTAIILDSSGSMGVQKRISIAKGIAKKLVENSYKRRDWLSLIVFRGNEAEVLIKPTKNYEHIFEVIDSIPTGGRTPLPSALLKFISMTNSLKNVHFKGILITDGKANVPIFKDVEEDLITICKLLLKKGIKLEIFDTRTKLFDPSPSYIDLISKITKANVYKS